MLLLDVSSRRKAAIFLIWGSALNWNHKMAHGGLPLRGKESCKLRWISFVIVGQSFVELGSRGLRSCKVKAANLNEKREKVFTSVLNSLWNHFTLWSGNNIQMWSRQLKSLTLLLRRRKFWIALKLESSHALGDKRRPKSKVFFTR